MGASGSLFSPPETTRRPRGGSLASLLLVVRPGAPSSFLFLVAMPGAPSSVLAPSSVPGPPKVVLESMPISWGGASGVFLGRQSDMAVSDRSCLGIGIVHRVLQQLFGWRPRVLQPPGHRTNGNTGGSTDRCEVGGCWRLLETAWTSPSTRAFQSLRW